MSPAALAALESWSLPIPLTLSLVLVALAYLRGWLSYRTSSPNTIPSWRLAAFMAGLFSVWIAEGSPLMAIDDDLLTIHMTQHILLMGVAPPLILLGAPVLPVLYGLPRRFVHRALNPILRWRMLRTIWKTASHPSFAWLAYAVALIGWHLPAAFELALRSSPWHDVEHACFFWTGVLFWWPVIQPWPSVPRWPRWRIPLYLFFATLPCDTLSAFLTFCGRVVYPYYLSAPRLFSLSPLLDQQCAGALMWVCATFIYLIPAVIITVQLLSAPAARFAGHGQAAAQRVPALERRSEAEVF